MKAEILRMFISQGNHRGIAPTQYRKKRRAYGHTPLLELTIHDLRRSSLSVVPFENFRAATEVAR
jgi:hypothetical protein